MTVTASTAKSGPYAGAGTTGPFTVAFRFLENSHLQVIRTSAAGIDTTLTLTSQYTVSGAGASSGSVTLVTALAVGEKLTIVRNVPFTQEADYVQNDAFPAESHERALDKLTMEVQQVAEVANRALVLPASTTGVSPALPAPEANKVLGWNNAASGLQNFDVQSLASVVAYGTADSDIFTGNGSQTQFVLSANPGVLDNLDVSVNGLTYLPGLDYTWVGGTTVTFSVAPAIGDQVLIRYMQALAIGTSDASLVQYTPAGAGAVARTAQAKLRESVSVLDFGAVGNGVADDTAAIQACINAVADGTTILFPYGTYKVTSQLLVSGRSRLTFKGDRGAKLLFTDGAYIGLLFTGASQQCLIDSLMIFGTEAVSPAITLLKFTGNSAYGTISNCQFAFASIGVLLAQSYIMRMMNNNYSNCNTALKATNAEGSVADAAVIGDTYGTCLIGANPVVDVQYNDIRFVGCYWETQTNSKKSLNVTSPTQRIIVAGCHFSASGEVHIQTSNIATITGNQFYNSHSNNRTIRVDGGAQAQVMGNYLSLSALSASVVGISCSGSAQTVGNYFNNYLQGTGQGAGTVSANVFANCTTGVVATGTTVLADDNAFDACTTNVTTSGTATAIAPSYFTGTLTGCATSPTGTLRYEVSNGVVHLTLPNLSAVSNATDCTITGLPAAIQPGAATFGSVALVLDNGVQSAEQCSVSGGTLTLYKNGSATGFTASGTKGIRAVTVTYRLRTVT